MNNPLLEGEVSVKYHCSNLPSCAGFWDNYSTYQLLITLLHVISINPQKYHPDIADKRILTDNLYE